MFKALLGGVILLVGFALTGQALAQGGTWATKAPMPTPTFAMGVGVVNGILYAVGGEVANDCTFVNTLVAYDPLANTWTFKAPMPTKRQGLRAGVVNGVLYAVGGSTGCGPRTGSVEAYDPASDTWTTKASMPTPRTTHAVGVVNGVLYAVGGFSGAPLSTVEAYDPVANTWTTKAPMPTARSGLAVGVVNGLLYAVGGSDGTANPTIPTTVEVYDPVANTWTTRAPMPTGRSSLAAGVVNGILYALGGGPATGGIVAIVEAYDPFADTWTTAPPMPTARIELGADVVNGVLYAVGGHGPPNLATNEAFTPAPAPGSGTWTTKAPMPTARTGVATGEINGQLYVMGGVSNPPPAFPLPTAYEVYDPATNTWATIASAPTSRAYAGAAGIAGKLYVVGGCINSDCNSTTNILEVFDPATNTWATKAAMPTARNEMGVGVVGGKLYVVGGITSSGGLANIVATLEVYDPATNTWTTETSMPTAREHVGGAVINGKFYVVGGQSSAGPVVATLEVYDPATNTWTTKTPMPQARNVLGAGEVNGILYAVSGTLADGTTVNTVEAYDPATDSWTTVAPIPTARSSPRPQGINGVLYVAGSGSGNTPITTLEAFTPVVPFAPLNQAPAITSANSTTFTVGTAGLFTLTSTGTPTPLLSETGALPTGVTFTDNGDGTATLAGAPAAGTGGTYNISFTASNGVGADAVQNFTLTVNQAPAIISANNRRFTVGTAGSFTVRATGFPTPTLSVLGALPSGVSFTDNGNGTATLSGTPAAGTGGTYNIIFTASNGVGADAVQNFTLTVNQAPAIISANNATFTVGAAGSFTVTATGFPTPRLGRVGKLPRGVTFKDNRNGTGTLSGTPAAGTAGVYMISFTASNGVGTTALQTFTLTVN